MRRSASLPLERRLQERFVMLVQSHMRAAPELAAGIASLPSAGSSFAATQAAWRFLSNERVTLPALIEPLRQAGIERANASPANFLLLIHDWCKLGFHHPRRKLDLVQLTHETDVGYELTTALLVDAAHGCPLAPMEIHVRTAKGVLSTREPAPKPRAHLEQVLPTMRASGSWGLAKPIIHVIDREADSVDHYRRWDADGHFYLIRADDRRVRCEGKSCLLTETARQLHRQQKLQECGTALYQGSEARLWLGETMVVLHRPAKKNVRGRKFTRAGRALPLRCIVVQVRNDQNHVLAQWILLSNAPLAWASTEQLARCYYWRWRIESYFKLLKSHGQQLEHWQQESGPAVARRLLVASMACVIVWQLQADDSPAATQLKTVLVRLSGRQMKRKRTPTAPALLAGLWVLLSMTSMLQEYSLRQLKQLIKHLPYLPAG
jgi:hypothetical protein